MTISEFVKRHGITFDVERTHYNPNMPESERDMDHWFCTLLAEEGGTPRHMHVYFSKGFGHEGAEPTVEEVLSCLADDSAYVEDEGGFEGWCQELGYDEDSRKAYATYQVCLTQSRELARVLGHALYVELLSTEIERE